jgi:NAD(P)-dependent dehydrogenase (short-subunit alcohol dehydrogenase family)
MARRGIRSSCGQPGIFLTPATRIDRPLNVLASFSKRYAAHGDVSIAVLRKFASRRSLLEVVDRMS